MKSRQRTADLLKGLAVIFMIQVHLMELFALQQIFDGALGKASLFLGGPPAAPVFMAVMGFYLAQSKKGLVSSLKRGLKLILWGFALNIGLNLNLFYHIYEGSINLSPLEYIFGVDILFLAGLSLIIIAFLKHIFSDKILVYVIVLIITILIPEFINPPAYEGVSKYFGAYLYSDHWWSYFPLIPWFAYVLIGYIFNLEKENISLHYEKNKLKVIFGTFTLFILGLVYKMDVSANLEQYYHHGVFYFFFVLIFIILWASIAHEITIRFNNKFTAYIEWLGKNVTRAYVFQWLIIGNIATAVYKTQNEFQLSLWLIGILILVSLAVYGWGLMKNKSNN